MHTIQFHLKNKTARNGKWVKGPGFDLFKDKLDYPIIAEDLGYIDDDFRDLMKKINYPGMKIVTQGVLDLNKDNEWRPSNYTYNYFSYTSTHDSETTLQFLDNLTKEQYELCLNVVKEECELLNVPYEENMSKKELTLKLVELNLASKSKVAMTPVQDLIPIGKEGRMNFPSTLSTDNWSFRITKEDLIDNKERIITFLKEKVMKYKRG